jgi:RecA/RadA recombinase
MGEGEKHFGEVASGLPEFKTNIAPLDSLLGYNEDLGRGTGIKAGDIIVLRGGPGSGKTTLGLQIMSSYLASDDCRHAGDKLAVVFFSLEIKPTKMFKKMRDDFGFFGKRADHFYGVRAGQIKYLLHELGKEASAASLTEVRLGELTQGILKTAAGPGKELVVPLAHWLIDLFTFILKPTEPDDSTDEEEKDTMLAASSDDWRQQDAIEGILFIDSINALWAMLGPYLPKGGEQPRLAMKRVLEWIRRKCNRFIVLISSEFHHEASWVPLDISESYLSDVEILLTNEPIVVPAGYEAGRQGSVGYNIFKIIERVEGEEGTKLESRSFIRVLKSRSGANQSRRCAYDIVSGIGVKFYETYPGDGHILLFTENPKQDQVWDTFFQEDLPQTYPALRYEKFDRSSLQRTFHNQRRFRYVPRRTDMYVSSFDNYWINWYGELCWRQAVVEAIEQQIPINEDNESAVAKLTSAIHRSLMEQGRPLLVREPDSVKNDDSVSDAVLTAFAGVLRTDRCIKCFSCRTCWWLLQKIMQTSPDLEHALTHVARENARVEAKTDKSITGNGGTVRVRPSKETQQMIEILAQLRESTSGCCDDNPVRQFYARFHKARVGTDLAALIAGPTAPGYTRLGMAEVEREKWASETAAVLRSTTGSRASELSKKTNELAKWIKADDVRENLEKKLWNCAEHARQDSLESKVKRLLEESLEGGTGCECKAEFWSRLRDALTKVMEDAKGTPTRQNQIAVLRKSLLNDADGLLLRLFDALLPTLLETPYQKSRQSVLSLWKECTGDRESTAERNLVATYRAILEKRNTYHFLSRVPDRRLRLFGERRSFVIKELDTSSPDNKRPIHRPALAFSLHDTKSFVSIPYNANIGFLVYREDLLRDFVERHLSGSPTKTSHLEEYLKDVHSLYANQCALLAKVVALPPFDENKVRVLIERRIHEYVTTKRPSSGPLSTWEEVIALLRLMHRYYPRPNKKGEQRWHFVIETQTFDTLLCTILEFLWNCGADLTIRPDYSIENEDHTKGRLFQALYLLGIMLKDGIITEDSTLDTAHFADRYSKRQRSNVSHNREDWVFARQWYSTLVELLTAKNEPAPHGGPGAAPVRKKGFRWQNPKAQLRIMPIPISLSYYLQDVDKACHMSCWGDWHWIMTRGTENTELGIDLINDLMGSQKVCERAFQCAAVPTVDAFYELYGDSRCLNLAERRYYSPDMLPDTTFTELKETYFKDARSRSRIFDYEHCMLEFHSLFQFVKVLARDKLPDWRKLDGKIDAAFDRIRTLGEKRLLVY